jgi:hypothetical protein
MNNKLKDTGPDDGDDDGRQTVCWGRGVDFEFRGKIPFSQIVNWYNIP